ncbi:Leucoanthocyanidin reductase [Linum perenne]
MNNMKSVNGLVDIEAGGGRTMIIGSTGCIGWFIADACLQSGRPTYLLVRPGPGLMMNAFPSSSKACKIKSLIDKGATILHGCIKDGEMVEKMIRENKIEVVISAVGGDSVWDQIHLVKAIKAAGALVKRFVPSEFGHDIDRAEPVEPGLSMYKEKRKVRRFIEECGVPYTYICCNSIAAWPYHDNPHPSDLLPPLDRFHIYGDGSVQAYFVAGTDIGKFTMRAVEDARTLNKTLHFQPKSNLLNINQLAHIWESQLGRDLPRVTITEDDLLSAAKEMRIPQSIVAALTHDIFIKGCQVNYKLNKPSDVEVCSLYPEVPFRTVDDCFKDLLTRVIDDNDEDTKNATKPTTPSTSTTKGSTSGIILQSSKTEAVSITA